VLWTIGLIAIFHNLGFDVTAIIAGLGVGGIAIALAAQTILGDLFNYFVILFDQPFEPGDFIVVDEKMGTIEHIGLKTTRIRSLQGEQIIFSNTNLTNSRIHNYKRMNERRVLFQLGVVYDTPVDKLKIIPTLIRKAIDDQDFVRFDRVHFASFGEYSMKFEAVYHVISSDYNQYMDIQQGINLAICEQFRAEGIQFALPAYSISPGKAFTANIEAVLAPNGKVTRSVE
jgi:small-conductance mechanosensitive channel